MVFFPALFDWLKQHTWTVFGVTLAMFVGTLVLLPLVVAYLPADYFTRRRRLPRRPLGWLLLVVKNLLGAVFLVMGLAMLVLPGQGLLTILLGVMLVDFPGKRGWEWWLVRRRGVRPTIDWMRKKAGRPPLDYGPRLAPSKHEIQNAQSEANRNE